MTVSRRQAREWAVQMLTAADLNPPDDVDSFIADFWEQAETLEPEEGGTGGDIGKKMRAFVAERVKGVLADGEIIDRELVAHLAEWDLYRLGTVERAVLRLGAWEIGFTDVPKAVVINEAIDVANWFSTPKSRTLINGVLDKCGPLAR